jgi:hypothetical protein
VRRLLLAVTPTDAELASGGLADAVSNRGLEVFPKQDRIRADGYGNQIWLPWWSGAAPGGNVFYQSDSEDEVVPFAPELFETVSLQQLADVAAALPAPEPARPKAASGNGRPRRAARDTGGRVAHEELLRRALDRIVEGSDEGRNGTGLWLACQLRDNRYSRAEALVVMAEFVRRAPQGGHP